MEADVFLGYRFGWELLIVMLVGDKKRSERGTFFSFYPHKQYNIQLQHAHFLFFMR